MSTAPNLEAEALDLLSTPRVEELVDRATLAEVLRSFRSLFGVSCRVLSATGSLLADATGEQPEALCALMQRESSTERLCEQTVLDARSLLPQHRRAARQACFTGAAYEVVPLELEGATVARLVVGPFVLSTTGAPPPALFEMERALNPREVTDLLAAMPHLDAAKMASLVEHLRTVLEALLFSGRRVAVTAQMHLATVRASHRELAARNEQLSAALDKQRDLDRLKSNFLATVSHELRTPLTSILGYADMLLEGVAGDLGEEPRDFVQTIREHGSQLLTLISSLLDLGAMEQGGSVRVAQGEVALEHVAKDVLTGFLPTARKRKLTLQLDVQAPVPAAVGDRERLRQVVTNLLDNALKFSPDGGTVTVTVRGVGAEVSEAQSEQEPGFALLAPARQDVELRVRDHGRGIPASERERVFDAFYQVDSSSTRQHGGAGLGLAIVQRIVTAHGGTVRIEDPESGAGTVVVVRLPAAAQG